MSDRTISARRALAGLGALFLVTAAAAAVRADEPVVSARLFTPLPADLAIAVEPLDDTDANLQLRDSIVTELTAQHRLTAQDAPLRLRFSTSHLSDIQLQRNEAGGGLGAVGRMPMISDDLGTALPNRTLSTRPVIEQRVGGVKYRLQATLERRAGGAVIWQGEAIGTPQVNEGDEKSLGRELASALVARLGQTVDPSP